MFMQEDVRLDEAGRVHLLRPQDLALAGALGLPTLPVRRALGLALFSTQEENIHL